MLFLRSISRIPSILHFLIRKAQHSTTTRTRHLANGPGLQDFISSTTPEADVATVILQPPAPYLPQSLQIGHGRKVYLETYGCQMNFSDAEIVRSVLDQAEFTTCTDAETADVVFLMTCAIRDGAEAKVWDRLAVLHSLRRRPQGRPTIGVLGCMAERLKSSLLEAGRGVDIVAGPDAYRTLPHLLTQVDEGQSAVNVLLSADETYADIRPVRLDKTGNQAFVSIMRGCNNMCSFCIVPFTRGRERSRPVESILEEVKTLSDNKVKEIILLGQNVNSYADITSTADSRFSELPTHSMNMKSLAKTPDHGVRFAELLHRVAQAAPNSRIRFTSPHPQFFPDAVLSVMLENRNICRNVHLPAQSGSTSVLERMRRGYSREAYLDLVQRITATIPGVTFTTDMISGFCGETEEEHQDTVTLMQQVPYSNAFTFAYSMREKTHAHHKFKDDVPSYVKQRRLTEVIAAYRAHALKARQAEIGSRQLVLVEGPSKKSKTQGLAQLWGRCENGVRAVFDDVPLPRSANPSEVGKIQVGDYLDVDVYHATHTTLYSKPLARTSLREFYQMK